MVANPEIPRLPVSKQRFFHGYTVVAVALCIMIATWGTYYAFGVFFKPLLTEFGWTRAMTSGAFSFSTIVYGFLAIIMGGLTDRFGPRLVVTFCGFFLGLGYLLMSQVASVWQLYLVYGVVVGLGLSGGWVPLLSTVARWFVARRSMMTGIVLTGEAVGTLVAPLAASRLIFAYDWRMSYIIVGSIVLVIIVVLAQLLRRDPYQLGQVPYGESEVKERRLELGDKGFSLREAVYTRQFWLYSTMVFCLGVILLVIVVHIVPHAIELGIPATRAANILATIGGLTIVGRVTLGTAADRIGNRQVFIIGFILMSLSSFWLMLATDMWMLYLFAVLFGFAYGGMGASESPIIAAFFGLSAHGLILGVTGLVFSVGAALGPLMAGYIFDITGSYHIAFLVLAALGIVGLILAILLTPTTGKQYKIENI